MPDAPRSDAAGLPVRPGEEPWTDAELKQVRADLESETATLRADLARAASGIAELLTDSVRDAGDDQADAGTKAFEREHELALNQHARELLDQGERALGRIDAGTYGVCGSCGQPIGKARLLAFPAGEPVRDVQAAGGTPLSAQEPSRPRRVGLLLGVAVAVIAADLISKVLVVANIPEYTYVHLIGRVFMLTQVRNGGAAFNLGGTSMTIVFTLIAAGVIGFILRAAGRMRSTGWAAALGLLLGGAAGNLIDRIFRAPGPLRGDVVDWIYVTRYWPVFNVADSCIVCGGMLLGLLALRGIRLDGTRVPGYRAGEADHDASAPARHP